MNYNRLMWVLLCFGAGLRLLLFWSNPPQNAFDDHYEPIFLILRLGAIPAKNACFECYHPPLFYLTSAAFGWVVYKLGAGVPLILKSIQFLSCLYGILTIWVVYLILKRLPLPDFAKLLALGTVSFLPTHIYMSAMNSNDSLSFLTVSVSMYLIILLMDEGFSSLRLAGLGVAMAASILTKITCLVVFPMAATAFGLAFYWKILPRKKIAASFIMAFILPLIIFGWQIVSSKADYGKFFPINLELMNIHLTQIPGEGKISFLDFKPWQVIREPIITPGNAGSFWTTIYGRMWFDMESYFIRLADRVDIRQLKVYIDYLQGVNPVWTGMPDFSKTTLLTGSVLIALGLVPVLLTVTGFFLSVFGKSGLAAIGNNRKESIKILIFPVVFLFNSAGVVMTASKFPFYSAMKAAYFLNSIAAFAVFLGLAIYAACRWHTVKSFLAVFFVILFLSVTVHIVDLSFSIMRNVY